MPCVELWQNSEHFCVLDTSFGDGSQFTRLRDAWRGARGRSRSLHYVTLCGEAFGAPPAAFAQVWPLPLRGHHRIPQDNPHDVHLSVVFGEPNKGLQRLAATFDLILLAGAFEQASDLARVSRTGTTLYSVGQSESFLNALERSGFALEHKAAALTRGHFRGRNQRSSGGKSYSGSRRAIVVGAGLAGTAAASSLASRGWSVVVLDKQAAAAGGASGNRSAAISPLISKDDGIAAQLSRASFLALLQELRRFDRSATPVTWSACGLLQMAKNEREESVFKQALDAEAYPPQYVRFLNQDEASSLTGWPVQAPGLYFEEGGWINPASLCQARLKDPNIRLLGNTDITRITYEDGIWRAHDGSHTCLAEAPVLVLANAFDALGFDQSKRLVFKKVRGQVTHVPEDCLPTIRSVLTRDGYLTPAMEGTCSLGATYDFDCDETGLKEECQLQNLGRIPLFLKQVEAPALALSGRVGFRTLTPDRLPVVGAMPDPAAVIPGGGAHGNIARLPGLYALLGLGSRGAVWSTLAGETLAALIEGEPSPLPSDLLSAVDPARFWERTQRSSTLSSTNPLSG